MKLFLLAIIIFLFIRFFHIQLLNKEKVLKCIKKLNNYKILKYIKKCEQAEKQLFFWSVLLFMLYFYSELINIILFSALSLRFFVKLINNSDFINLNDVFFAFLSIFLMIINFLNSKTIMTKLDNLLNLNSNNHLIQVIFIHMFILVLIFSLLLSIVVSITIFYYMIYDSKESFVKVKRESKRLIIKIDIFIYKLFKIQIFELINDYINPIKEIKKIDFTSAKLIKNIILFFYVITGIIVIFYWKECIGMLGECTNAEMSPILNLPINDKDLDNYKLIFIMPLLGILLSKKSNKTTEKSNEK